jgi:hypothetical protein
MKFWILAAAVAAASLSFAQQTEPPPEPKPQVVISGQPQSPAPNAPAAATADHPSTITDADRTAVAITAWDLDVHLNARQQSMEAQARVTLRNSSASPLDKIALQLSSTLNFDMIGLHGKKIAFQQNTIPSDADHTGQLHEAVIPLDEPLAPQSSLSLEVDYGGAISLTAQRLIAIGAPDATAQASDWDRISEDFTGLRGFGNVVWYPVSSLPVSMGDGAKLFAEIGRQKLLDQDATASLRVTDEFLSEPPNAAILDGHYVSLDKPAAMPTASFPGVITASVPATRLGFEVPSLFLARRVEAYGNGLRVLALDADAASAQTYIDAARLARPLVRTWLGNPKDSFTILDLPEPDDAPAETGGLLATPLSTDDAPHLTPVVVHALAHGAFTSPRAWLNEGVAAFLGTLWIEANQGRTAAIENLNAGRPALTLAEPATPGEGAGEDLLHAISPACYRTKAMYVLWMLRAAAGDKALQSALQAYDPAQDTRPEYFEHLLEQSSGRDLKWFFDDWVDRDRGLPDLSIAGVYPSREAHQTVLVAIEIANDGYAEVEVPVTVKGVDASVTQQVRVPAHGRITWRITFQENPTEVDLNDGTVPEVQASIHRRLLPAQ